MNKMSFISEMKWALTMSLKMKQRPFFVITYTIAMLKDRRRNKAAKETEVMCGGFDFIPSKNRETEPPYFIEFNGSPGTGHLNEFNDINIYKLFIDVFKNRENWR